MNFMRLVAIRLITPIERWAMRGHIWGSVAYDPDVGGWDEAHFRRVLDLEWSMLRQELIDEFLCQRQVTFTREKRYFGRGGAMPEV